MLPSVTVTSRFYTYQLWILFSVGWQACFRRYMPLTQHA